MVEATALGRGPKGKQGDPGVGVPAPGAAAQILALNGSLLPAWVTLTVALLTDATGFGRSLIKAADAAAVRGLLDLEVGIDVQAFSAQLAALAGVSLSGNQFPVANGSGGFFGADLTAIGLNLITQPTQANLRTNGLGMSADGSALVVAANFAAMKTLLALNNVSNTTDANKPVSTAQQAALDAKLDDSQLDTDPTLAANSDSRIASQKATKAYVDGIVAAQDAMVFKGVIDCSANPNYPAADCGWTYRVSAAGKIGGNSGPNVQLGDMLICLVDGTPSGNQAAVGSAWAIIQTNIDGALTTADIGVYVQAYSSTLAALASASANGVSLVTAANYGAMRTLLGLVIGTDVQAYAAILGAISALGATGLIARTGAGAVASRTLTAPAAGISVSNGDGVSGNPTLALANDLAALEGLASMGLIVRTGDGAATTRAVTGTVNEITVANGDGVSGAPTLSLPSALTFTGKTVTGGTFAGASSLSIGGALTSGKLLTVAGSVDFSTDLLVGGALSVVKASNALAYLTSSAGSARVELDASGVNDDSGLILKKGGVNRWAVGEMGSSVNGTGHFYIAKFGTTKGIDIHPTTADVTVTENLTVGSGAEALTFTSFKTQVSAPTGTPTIFMTVPGSQSTWYEVYAQAAPGGGNTAGWGRATLQQDNVSGVVNVVNATSGGNTPITITMTGLVAKVTQSFGSTVNIDVSVLRIK